MSQQPAADGPVLERVMKSDTQLWKLARNQWHLLLIQGMLMEHDSKKVFAKVSKFSEATYVCVCLCMDVGRGEGWLC